MEVPPAILCWIWEPAPWLSFGRPYPLLGFEELQSLLGVKQRFWKVRLAVVKRAHRDGPEGAVRDEDEGVAPWASQLASAGIEVDLPFIYAAYHENSQRFVYYLGELLSVNDAVETRTLRFYEFDNITWEEINDAAIIAMLERFIHEKRLGNYRVYIGSQEQGEMHPV